jgi:hypothetical protein
MSELEPEEDDDDLDEDDFAPLVVIARVADVAAWMPDGLGKKFGALACWFLLEQDAELVGLFDRVPEDPMSKGQVAAILAGLRAFAAERADELQAVLGPSDGIGLGFHTDATLARVHASFEEDGFAIVGAIEGGHVIDPDPGEPDDDDEPEP